MNHLHFVQSLEPLEGGGLGRAAYELHSALLERGVSSSLVTTTGNGVDPEFQHCRQFPRRGPTKAFFSPDLRREAGALAENSDLLHGHGFYVSTNWLLGTEARKRNKPLVYHPHGMFEPWILQNSRWKKKAAHLLFENRNFSAARLWRALTGKEADQIREQGITAPVVVAPNGIHLPPFDNVKAPARGERKRLLFLGRIHPKKGLDLLADAWGALHEEYPDWELVIAGPDEGGHLADITERSRRAGGADRITYTGSVTGDEKVRLLKSADLFVLSSYSEGFSVAVLEALACGVPVLLTNACNFPELARGGAGWECVPDPYSLIDTLEESLSASDAERRQRGAAGRRMVESHYTWDAIARTILDACEEHCR